MSDVNNRKKIMRCVASFVVFTASIVVHAQLAQNAPSSDEIVKITSAVSQLKAVEPPPKQRKLLVFSRSWGYKHSAIPYGKKAVEIMAQKTGAFEATITDDDSFFEPQNLKQFDAILFNNTNNEIFLPEDFDKLSPVEQAKAAKRDELLKASLVDFLAGGKGLAVIHAGVASFRKWPEFGEIMAARFDNHPWVAGSTVTLKVEEPAHPVVKAFKEPLFVVTDEVYQFTGPYTRDKVRVLLSIDTSKTSIVLDQLDAVHRKDKDFAITWVKSYGKGRVFYCALGHEHDLFWNPIVLQHYLDGIQFALGDLPGDMTTSAQIQTKSR
jgi:type 1 glutamine amidotransferase